MPRDPRPIEPDAQLALWRQGVTALGGNRPAARKLKIHERQLRFLNAGQRPLHDGFLREMAAALVDHADHCRALERKLSPAFSANLTGDQRELLGKRDGRRRDAREKADG